MPDVSVVVEDATEVTPRWHDAAAAGVIIATITAFFRDILFSDKVLFLRDIATYHYPTKRIVREIILSGSFPWWNPYLSGGQPLAANPAYEVFYPPQLLILLFDFTRGFHLHIVFHFWATALGLYFLLRTIRVKPFSALLVSLSFGLSPFLAGLSTVMPLFFGASWWGWCLGFTIRFVRRGRIADLLGASVAAAMTLIVAEPSAIVQLAILQIALLMTMIAGKGWRLSESGRLFGKVALIGVFALLLSLVQLIPAADLASETTRAAGLKKSEVLGWSMPLARPLELVVPQMFGPILDNGAYYWAGKRLYGDRAVPYVLFIYTGLLIPLAAIAGILRRRGRWMTATGVFVASYILASGSHGGVFPLLYELGFDAMRYPEKFICCGVFALAVYAATQLDDIREMASLGVRRIVLLASAGFALAAFAVLGVAYTPSGEQWFYRLWDIGTYLSREVHYELFRSALAGAALRWTLMFLIFAFIAIRPRSRVAMSTLFLLFVVADARLLARDALPRLDQSFYDRPAPAARLVPDFRAPRFFPQAQMYDQSMGAEFYKVGGRVVPWIWRNSLNGRVSATWQIPTIFEIDFDRTNLLHAEELTNLLVKRANESGDAFDEPFIWFGNIGWISVYADFATAMQRASNDPSAIRPVLIARVSEPQRRYYLADRIIRVESRREFEQALDGGRAIRSAAIVDARAPVSAATGRGVVTIQDESYSRVDLEVESSEPSFLVASVTGHKYWRATVDDSTVSIVRTNLAFQGMTVPEGTHRVTLTYFNPLVAWCGLISGLTLLGLSGAALLPRWWRRRDSTDVYADPNDVTQHPE